MSCDKLKSLVKLLNLSRFYFCWKFLLNIILVSKYYGVFERSHKSWHYFVFFQEHLKARHP